MELVGRTQTGYCKVSLAGLRQLAKGMAHCNDCTVRLLVETTLVVLGHRKFQFMLSTTNPLESLFEWCIGGPLVGEKKAMAASSMSSLIMSRCCTACHSNTVSPMLVVVVWPAQFISMQGSCHNDHIQHTQYPKETNYDDGSDFWKLMNPPLMSMLSPLTS